MPCLPPSSRRRALRYLLVAAALAVGVRGETDAPALPSAPVLKALSVDQLMELDVTSVSKRPERLFTAAAAIQVITADDVRRSGATSFPESLRLASNLEVAQIDSRQWAITARGFNNVFADKMLVLIDGRSVYTPLYAGVYWDVQDTMLEDLDRIEVISGPGATQWGANAVNGVINLTTKSAKDTQGGLVVAGIGSELRESAAVRYGGQLAPGVYYRTYAKYSEHDDSVRPDGRRSNDAWHLWQGGFRVDRDPVAGNAFTVQGDLYGGAMGQAGPDSTMVRGGNLLGRWTHLLADNSDLRLQVYFDYTHRSIPNSFTQDLDTTDVDFQHRFPVGSTHDVVWGVGYRVVADSIINTPANAFLPPEVTREWFNTFAQDEITLSKDRLLLTVGTKLERDAYTGVQLEPSARLTWTPDRQNTWWTAVSRAVRTPSRVDRDLFSPATPPYRVAGGEKVVSEKELAYELGYRVQVSPRLLCSVALFYHDYDDLRSLEPLNPPAAFPVEANSNLQGHSSGAEFSADWRVSSTWRLRAGYNELRVSSAPQPGVPDRGTRDSVARDPNRTASLRSAWDLSPKWELDAELRYVAPIAIQNLPGFTEGNLRIGWNPTATCEVSLVGQNLLHDHHPEFNSPGTRRELERGIFTKATWRF